MLKFPVNWQRKELLTNARCAGVSVTRSATQVCQRCIERCLPSHVGIIAQVPRFDKIESHRALSGVRARPAAYSIPPHYTPHSAKSYSGTMITPPFCGKMLSWSLTIAIGLGQDADGVGQQNPIPLYLSLLVQDR